MPWNTATTVTPRWTNVRPSPNTGRAVKRVSQATSRCRRGGPLSLTRKTSALTLSRAAPGGRMSLCLEVERGTGVGGNPAPLDLYTRQVAGMSMGDRTGPEAAVIKCSCGNREPRFYPKVTLSALQRTLFLKHKPPYQQRPVVSILAFAYYLAHCAMLENVSHPYFASASLFVHSRFGSNSVYYYASSI